MLGVGCGAQIIIESVLFGRGKLERYSGCVIKQMCVTNRCVADRQPFQYNVCLTSIDGF